jgi:glycosyltransferase involved in cell wall biosynthesis
MASFMRIGIYNRWLHVLGGGERFTLYLAQILARDNEVYVISQRQVNPGEIQARLGIDITNIRFEIWPNLPDVDLSKFTVPFDLFINASHMSVLLPQATRNVLIVYFPSWSGQEWWQPLLSLLSQYIVWPLLRIETFGIALARLMPDGLARLYRIPPLHFRKALKRYNLICAISRFTQQWIAEYWGLPSEIIYPPVDIDKFTPLEKRNIILSVGRFFSGGHNKKQLEMVQAFKYLCTTKGLHGWEFHLVGNTTCGFRHQRYLDKVRAEAEGYPVFFHLDAPFEVLQQLYGQAKIYWHASGYGENVNRRPDRFEHFGISTVEAMAAGCVPVVIGKGGQKEIVIDHETGFLWETLEELMDYTEQLARNPTLWAKMSQAALQRAQDFSKGVFASRVYELMLNAEKGG